MRRAPGLLRLSDAGRGLGTGLLGAAVGGLRGLRDTALHLRRGARRLLRGEPLGALGAVGRALVQLAQLPLDAHLLVGGRLLGALQVLLGLESPGRTLRAHERDIAACVFGAALDLDAVRIKEGPAGLLGVSRRAFTLGNTVYVPPDCEPLAPGLLVHELTHVWQYQHGGSDYLSEALWAQLFGQGYDWERGLASGRGWEALNPEQQAALLEHAFVAGALPVRLPPSASLRAGGWTEARLRLLQQVLAGLAHGRGARGS